MQHQIKPKSNEPRLTDMAEAVSKCVHCGFCLAACPTYHLKGEEMNSPRGRILLMKEVLEEELSPAEAAPFIDNCLGCLACEPACPSGVAYGDLLTGYRFKHQQPLKRPFLERLIKSLLNNTLPYPYRMRLALKSARLTAGISSILPDAFKPLLQLLPDRLPETVALPSFSPANGERRGQVALLAGCAQQVLAPSINLATIKLLNACGYDVITPADQGCCGSILMHNGSEIEAKKLASKNMTSFPDDVEAVITNAAGCGSGIQEYGYLFKGSSLQSQAEQFANKTIDISRFLLHAGFRPGSLPEAKTYAYQDACHLKNAQKIASEPRQLLKAIPNLTLVEIGDNGRCCGSAGTYNIEQPEDAKRLGMEKAEAIRTTKAEGVISGNIGCITQIKLYVKENNTPVYHTVEVLAETLSSLK